MYILFNMTTTIQKWGNSYAVRIPKEVVMKLHLKEGQAVTIEAEADGRSLSVTPTTSSEQSLNEMVSLITPENRHTETDWSTPVGREIW